MTSALGFALLPFALTAAVFAGVTPTAPGPGQTFNAGSNCTIQWDVDQSETWKNVTIDLMSGSNSNMSFVTNVAWGLDGTDPTLTPFNWTCPEVDPYAPIYFYQFTNGLTGNVTWTTRFTIASSSAEYFSPTNATQPNGDPIPWGTGILAANGTDSTSTSSADSDEDEDSGSDPSDSSSEPDSTSDDATAAADSLGQLAHPEQAAPLNLTAMDKHSGDAEDDDTDSREKGDKSDDDNNDEKGSQGDSSGDDDSEDGSEVSGDKAGDGKSANSKDDDASHSGSSNDENKSSSAGENGSPGPSSSTSSSVSHKTTSTLRSQDGGSGGTTKSSGPAPSASSVKKSHPSSSAEPSAAATGAAISPDSAAPTPALPPTSKKPHPTSASASAGGPSASKATHAAGSTNTCSCSSSDQPSGLSKLLNGGAREVEKVSGWTHLFVPLVIALLVLY